MDNYHSIVAKDFQLRVGFALDGTDLLIGFVLLFCFVNCTKFCTLMITQIINIGLVATRCQIPRPKCTKFDFGWGWGSALDPTGGA